MSRELISKGLLKLMIRLPALRSELQILHAHEPALRELCDAYGEATDTLASMRADPRADPAIIIDYEGVCSGLEAEVVELCANWNSDVQ